MKKRTLLVALAIGTALLLSAQDVLVYVTRTGSKYHREGCPSLRAGATAMSLAEAAAAGYEPCARCDPPRASGAATGSAPLTETAAEPAMTAPVKASYPYELSGTVVGISDGDTLTVLVDSTPRKIRLNGVDAPESRQAHGTKAKEFLAALAFRKDVTLRVVDTDRYGRLVADVIVDGRSAGAALIEAGYAWHYKAYSKDPALAALELEARKRKAGLWSDPAPVAPWEFRRR